MSASNRAEAEDRALRATALAHGLIPARTALNISRNEQRVLHVLAQGGFIRHVREDGRVVAVDCIDRDGNRLLDCDLATFARLRRRRLIHSVGGSPYRLTEFGRRSVRAQPDNR